MSIPTINQAPPVQQPAPQQPAPVNLFLLQRPALIRQGTTDDDRADLDQRIRTIFPIILPDLTVSG